MAIDFTLSPEQRALQQGARDFAAQVLAPVAEKLAAITDPAEAFYSTREVYREMAHAGFTKSFIPNEFGGGGVPLVDFAIAAEELARVDVNVPTTLLGIRARAAAGDPIRHGGAEGRLLRPFVEDPEGDCWRPSRSPTSPAARTSTRPDPAGGIQTLARRDGDEWVITGEKHYTTNGTGWDGRGAHLYTVVCRTDPTEGADESLAVIAVPGAIAGRSASSTSTTSSATAAW